MFIIKRTYFSTKKPEVLNGLWLKPVTGGFALYIICEGSILPLKMVNDNGTVIDIDDEVANYETAGAAAAVKLEVVGTSRDSKTASTVNGAKAFATNVGNTIVGSDTDASTAATINGAKAFASSIGDSIVGEDTDASTDMTLNGLKKYIDEQIAALG